MLFEFDGVMPDLGEGVWVHEMAYVCGNVFLAEGVSVWPMAVLRGDVASIKVGRYSNIQDGAVVHGTHASARFDTKEYATKIGDFVIVGHHAVVHGCEIGSEVLIGMNATVLDGAVIEDRVLLAAGSLVPPRKRLESGFLYAGNPVEKRRALTEKECAFFKYSAMHYHDLAKRHAQRTVGVFLDKK